MTSLRLLLLTAVTLLSWLGAIECPPAIINLKDRPPIEGAYVESESIDKLVYYLGNPKDPRSAKSELTHDKYTSVSYLAAEDGNYQAAEVNYDKGEWAKAAEFFKRSGTTAKWFWELETGLLKSAECYDKLNQPDNALAALKELSDKFPQTVHQPEVVARRGALRLAKGDLANADTDFKAMVAHADQWGGSSLRDGMIGQRNVLRLQKKFAEAVALLTPFLAKLQPETQSEDYAIIGMAIADDQDSGGKPADALATCKKLYLAAIGPEAQGRAHLKAARLLAVDNTTAANLAAFDQVALAAALSTDDDVALAARKLGREIGVRIEHDKKVSDADRKEYRAYVGSL
jgi:tetratricopeptide (TPR) repeat protein